MNNKRDFTIGILGGMGTYATIHIFKQYADVFKAEKEWDRPRILIDNRCTMPSRVRAFLYGEKTEQLVLEMIDSIKCLVKFGGIKIRIILACNTSHIFLPVIYKQIPEAMNNIVNIITECINQINKDGIKRVYLLGSEGTIESRVYQEKLADSGIVCDVPEEKEYFLLRKCIEAVKQDEYSEEIEKIFCDLMSRHNNYILGCTELPILYEKYKDKIEVNYVYDPILIVLKKLKREFENE